MTIVRMAAPGFLKQSPAGVDIVLHTVKWGSAFPAAPWQFDNAVTVHKRNLRMREGCENATIKAKIGVDVNDNRETS